MTKQLLEQTYTSLLRFYGSHDKIPLDVFAKQTGHTLEEAKTLLDDLGAGALSKFAFTERLSLPQAKEEKKIERATLSKAIPLKDSGQKVKAGKKRAKKDTSEEGSYAVPFLKMLALPLSIVSMVLSAYFGYLFLQKQFHPLLALTVSAVMVIFNVFCFEAGGLFLARKKMMWAGFFGVLSLAVSLYSIGTTISGLYESYLIRVYDKQYSLQETNANRKLYDSYVEEEKEKQVLMEDKRARLLIHQNALKELDTIEEQEANRKRYDTAYWGAWQIEKDVTVISKEISELRKKQQEVLKLDSGITRSLEVDNRPDIYTWLATIFHTSGDFMQFILQAIPAVALDAIASFSLFLFLFLRKREMK